MSIQLIEVPDFEGGWRGQIIGGGVGVSRRKESLDLNSSEVGISANILSHCSQSRCITLVVIINLNIKMSTVTLISNETAKIKKTEGTPLQISGSSRRKENYSCRPLALSPGAPNENYLQNAE